MQSQEKSLPGGGYIIEKEQTIIEKRGPRSDGVDSQVGSLTLYKYVKMRVQLVINNMKV